MPFRISGSPQFFDMEDICEHCGVRYGSHSGDTCPHEVPSGRHYIAKLLCYRASCWGFWAGDWDDAYETLYRLLSRDVYVQQHGWLRKFAWDLELQEN